MTQAKQLVRKHLTTLRPSGGAYHTTQSPMTQKTITELVECNTTSTRLYRGSGVMLLLGGTDPVSLFRSISHDVLLLYALVSELGSISAHSAPGQCYASYNIVSLLTPDQHNLNRLWALVVSKLTVCLINKTFCPLYPYFCNSP